MEWLKKTLYLWFDRLEPNPTDDLDGMILIIARVVDEVDKRDRKSVV